MGVGFLGFISEGSKIVKAGFLLSMNARSTIFFFQGPNRLPTVKILQETATMSLGEN